MAEQVWALRDEVWKAIEPLLPPRATLTTSRPRVPDRTAFNAIVFVSLTGVAWLHLPRELGEPSATAHRRLQERERAGVWKKLHAELLRRLNGAGQIDGATSVVDGSHIRALRGGLDRAVAG